MSFSTRIRDTAPTANDINKARLKRLDICIGPLRSRACDSDGQSPVGGRRSDSPPTPLHRWAVPDCNLTRRRHRASARKLQHCRCIHHGDFGGPHGIGGAGFQGIGTQGTHSRAINYDPIFSPTLLVETRSSLFTRVYLPLSL